MRSYSEVPNTPTPFSKASNDLKVGSIMTIPNTGRAILRYIGPVEGKSGRFAGIELLGESAGMGKNSGDVNGIEYFKTKQPGAGLFMTYDKLLGSIDYVESPPTKRLSLMNSPSNVFGPTPNRKRLSVTPGTLSHSRSLSKRGSLIRSNSATPPLPLQNKSSPSLEELKRLSTAKTLVENEKNNLLNETDSLKTEVEELKSRLEHHEKVIQELELAHGHHVTKIERAEAKVLNVENKLVKQKASHEEQREELLDVIDQLEAQVNDNEKLYIGELQRLQDEIGQKEVELLKYKSSENQISLDSSAISEFEKQLEQFKADKQDNDTLIMDLKAKLKENGEKIERLNRESLALKEATICDQKKYEKELKEREVKVAKLEEEHAVKDRVIEKLRDEIKSLKAKLELNVGNEDVDNLQKEVTKLKQQVETREKEIADNSKLQEQVKSLIEEAESSTDTINELKIKLENKESILKDLQGQLADVREAPTDAELKSADVHQLRMLNEELEKKENIIKDNETMLKVLDAVKREAETLREEIINKQQKLETKEKEIQSLKDSKDSKQSMQKKLVAKDKELASLRETMSDLQKQLRELKLIDQKKSVVETEREGLTEKLRAKEAETISLTKKVEELSGKISITVPNESILEEKNIEIELLKEELLLLKSKDDASEVHKLRNELDDLKKLNLSTTNNELNKQIELLQDELKTRPSASDFQELRSELELIDELRKVEGKDKDKEIEKLQILLGESTKRLNESTKRLTDSAKKEKFKPSQIYSDSADQKDTNRSTMSNLSLNRPPVISQVVDGALQIYVPESKDPANGRKLWCGLCEREGHDSIDCPYENDIF